MATLEYIFCCTCIIGICVLFTAAILAGIVVLVIGTINFIKESIKNGK